MFKEVQEEDESDKSSTQMQGETPDIILEHGKTRLTLDLDGWEWFWLFLAIVFIGSVWITWTSWTS